jgi:hypothetical protein
VPVHGLAHLVGLFLSVASAEKLLGVIDTLIAAVRSGRTRSGACAGSLLAFPR